MTWQEWMTGHLVDCGLWPNEAEAVVVQYREHTEPMAGRFNDVVEGYPIQMLAVVALGLRNEAIKWIDTNKPKHFARAILSETCTED